MKKILLLACAFISFATITQAQIKKGSVLLGGSINLDKNKMETETSESSQSNTLNFYPTVGFAIKENWVIGINAGFSNFEADPTVYYSYKRDLEQYSGGLFVRHYSHLGKNFYLYGNGSVNYRKATHSETNLTNYEKHYASKGIYLSLAPGIAYAISKRFHLEASLNDLLTAGYTTSDTKTVTETGGVVTRNFTKDKNFEFGANFNPSSPLSLGFRLVLGK